LSGCFLIGLRKRLISISRILYFNILLKGNHLSRPRVAMRLKRATCLARRSISIGEFLDHRMSPPPPRLRRAKRFALAPDWVYRYPQSLGVEKSGKSGLYIYSHLSLLFTFHPPIRQASIVSVALSLYYMPNWHT